MDQDLSVRCHSAAEIYNILGSHYYFAYGSNMSLQQMRSRAPSAERVGVAVMKDHELVFNRRGTYRVGGVASVVPARGQRVYGLVWKLSLLDLQRLDEVEDPQAYRRLKTHVYFLDGRALDECYIYEAIPEGVFAPDKDYAKLLVDAANEAGLPTEYVEYLQHFL